MNKTVENIEKLTVGRSDYEMRRAARLERLEAARLKALADAQAAFNRVDAITDMIPLGQPILVGHHSEARHRRDMDRVHDGMRKGIDANKRADRLTERIQAVEANDAISSDNPDALVMLKTKLDSLESERDRLKAFNTAYRAWKRNPASLEKNTSLSDVAKRLIQTWQPAFQFETAPIQPFELANLGTQIRSTKTRLDSLTKQAEERALVVDAEPSEILVGDIRVVANHDINRLQIITNGKPCDEGRAWLKSRGFRWSPTEGAWQRYLTTTPITFGKWVAEQLLTKDESV